MVKLTIDNKPVQVPAGTTILDAAKKVGIDIPTLCYFKNLNDIGACRVCVVEVEGNDQLSAACNTVVEDGMVVYTNSKRARTARKTNVELILSEHDCFCPTCVRSGNCALQKIANNLNVIGRTYEPKITEKEWDKTLPIIRDEAKCIKCMRCVQVCDKVQGMHVWEVVGTGSRTTVGVRGGKTLTEAGCTYCGQCITHCPVGALRERDDSDKLLDAIYDPEKVVVLQVAPAVRAAWGDGLGLSAKEATEKRMVAAFKQLGADYVFDTDWSADLTIMEEGTEFIQGFGKRKMPLFTSCCPGWVRFMKLEYPEFVSCLSSAKSPQQMFGAVTKSYFAEKIGVDPSKIFCCSIMPCGCKKFECDVEAVNDAGAGKDVDLSLTTREVDRLLRSANVNIKALKEEDFDSPLGFGTGAGVIFGATGGVMEAALRSAYFLINGKNPDADAFTAPRGLEGRKEFEVKVNKDITVKACVASGLANVRALMEDIKSGKAVYDFVEIMACPGGCAGGGGQPICDGFELAGERGARLYKLDKDAEIRFSHENPSITKVYEEYFEKPNSEKAHHLLHTDQTKWELK